jgi:uncharacterized membrane protein
MRILLLILAIVSFLAGAGVLAGARSAIHEIEAFILFLICAVFLSGAGIVESIHLVKKKLEEPLRNLKK